MGLEVISESKSNLTLWVNLRTVFEPHHGIKEAPFDPEKPQMTSNKTQVKSMT